MASVATIFSRIFFWSYERGSWQYDLAVIAILVFVLLTPAAWFKDQPQVGTPYTPEHVQRLSNSNGQQVYQIDARTLAPPEQTPQLQNGLHNILKRAVPELGNGRFEISNIEAVRDAEGTVIAYQVTLNQKK